MSSLSLTSDAGRRVLAEQQPIDVLAEIDRRRTVRRAAGPTLLLVGRREAAAARDEAERAAPRGSRERLAAAIGPREELAEAGDALGAPEQEEARMVEAVVKRRR